MPSSSPMALGVRAWWAAAAVSGSSGRRLRGAYDLGAVAALHMDGICGSKLRVGGRVGVRAGGPAQSMSRGTVRRSALNSTVFCPPTSRH